ncbi:MAG: transcriptional regulator, AraC family [Anaerosolibacter sp.]|jgi:GTP pyrophosphokinase|uniref:helix-turn-helix transcriptional regulator n=1 Tax=Anaerosolibacter sp. TaxID=1872527 RepID=UPI002629905C|nr:AraC family transcriptional regulator [Anaerosolibacter sp.]MDF2548550.1 transcriptional regulator, AraC family [Anaerosolibacter sp.]
MDFRDIMSDTLKYIEKNIKEPITAKNVAQNAGYSIYYFSRVFRSHIGLSIMEYVKDRRLIKASEEIADGRKIIDVALDYGYQSHSGFTKAFKNKFEFSPSLLRAFSFQVNCLGGSYNMSHVFMKNTDVHATKEELYELLVAVISENRLDYDHEEIRKAYEFACTAHIGEKEIFRG